MRPKPGQQQIKADLTRRATRHTLGRLEQRPRHRFRCQASCWRSPGSTSTMSDFKLNGATFGVSGDISLSDGSLAVGALLTRQAQPRRQCRRRDQAGSGQRAVRSTSAAQSLDARSLVRQFTADTSHRHQGDRSTGSVSVQLPTSRSSTGFHDERCPAVKLDYSRSGRQGELG